MIPNTRLKTLRKHYKLTADKVAKDLSCSKSLIYKLESGEIELTQDMLLRFSKYYDVSSDYLLGISENPIKELTLEEVSNNRNQAILHITKSLTKLNDRDLDIISNLIDKMTA